MTVGAAGSQRVPINPIPRKLASPSRPGDEFFRKPPAEIESDAVSGDEKPFRFDIRGRDV